MMSQSKGLGPTAAVAATLPVTGANTFVMVLAAVAVIVVGLLMVRSTRTRQSQN
jgi:LPXTG-motif cell wall-anchored protein